MRAQVSIGALLLGRCTVDMRLLANEAVAHIECLFTHGGMRLGGGSHEVLRALPPSSTVTLLEQHPRSLYASGASRYALLCRSSAWRHLSGIESAAAQTDIRPKLLAVHEQLSILSQPLGVLHGGGLLRGPIGQSAPCGANPTTTSLTRLLLPPANARVMRGLAAGVARAVEDAAALLHQAMEGPGRSLAGDLPACKYLYLQLAGSYLQPAGAYLQPAGTYLQPATYLATYL
jgi:hypothetical protein